MRQEALAFTTAKRPHAPAEIERGEQPHYDARTTLIAYLPTPLPNGGVTVKLVPVRSQAIRRAVVNGEASQAISTPLAVLSGGVADSV